MIPSFSPSPYASLQADAILPVQVNDLMHLGPEKRTSSKEAASNDRVAAITMMADQVIDNDRRIISQVDTIWPVHAQIVMVYQSVVAKTHFAGDGFHQRNKATPRIDRPEPTALVNARQGKP